MGRFLPPAGCDQDQLNAGRLKGCRRPIRELAPVLRLTTRPHRLPEGTMLKTNKISRRLVWAFVAVSAEFAGRHVSLCRAET
jgi:hypothetical protein